MIKYNNDKRIFNKKYRRSFMGMSTEEIQELIVKLQAAADNR